VYFVGYRWHGIFGAGVGFLELGFVSKVELPVGSTAQMDPMMNSLHFFCFRVAENVKPWRVSWYFGCSSRYNKVSCICLVGVCLAYT
jgi:hypothetical protein